MPSVVSLSVRHIQVFYAFDKLILMADGCMVYTGPPSRCLAYLARIGYVPPMDYNPADFVMDLVTSTEAGAAQVLSGTVSGAAVSTAAPSGADVVEKPTAKTAPGALVAAESRTNSDCSVDATGVDVDGDVVPDVESGAAESLIDKSKQKSIRTILIEAWDNAPIDAEIAAVSANFTAIANNANNSDGSDDGDDVLNVKYLASYKTQFVILLERALLNSKAVLVTNLTVFQAAAVALIAGALWWQVPNRETRVFDKASFIFFFMTYWFFSTLFHVGSVNLVCRSICELCRVCVALCWWSWRYCIFLLH
jgi:hypothetical protein